MCSVWEPHGNFSFGRFNSIGSVADVASDVEAKVTTNGTGGTFEGHGFTQHDASGLDGVKAFPHHATDWSRGHVFNESREKFLGFEVGVVSFQTFFGRGLQFKGLQFETTLFKTLDDFANKTALDTVGFDHDVGAFFIWGFGFSLNTIFGGSGGGSCTGHGEELGKRRDKKKTWKTKRMVRTTCPTQSTWCNA